MPPIYRIFSGDEPVTSTLAEPITDETEAKQAAQEVSEAQPESTVSVIAVTREPSGDWTQKIATYVGGKAYPWLWEVSFSGGLMDTDHARLSAAGITYMHGGGEIKDGVARVGLARHHVTVEASGDRKAADKVRDALAAQAAEMTEWTSVQASDESIRFRLADNPPPD